MRRPQAQPRRSPGPLSAPPASAPTCPYCGTVAQLVTGEAIYPRRPDLWAKRFWSCPPCKAYVGCHPGTTTPLGRLADATLRSAKQAAHALFDPLWQRGEMTREKAYAWLARELGIPGKDCHIGMFDVDTCVRVIEVCKKRRGLS